MKKYILFIIFITLLPFPDLFGVSIKIGINKNYPPHEFISEGKIQGFNIDIYNAIAEKVNIDIDFIPLSEENIYQYLKQGKIDCAAMSAFQAKYNNFSYIGQSILNLSLNVFVKSDIYNISKIEDLAFHTVAVEKEDISFRILNNMVKDAMIIPVEDHTKAMKLLHSGEVFACFGNKYTGLYILQELKYKDIKLVGDPITTQPRVLALGAEQLQIRNLFKKGLKQIKEDETYTKIYNKWFGYSFQDIKNKYVLNIVVLIVCILLFLIILCVLLWNLYLRKIIQDKVNEIEIKESKYSNLVKNTSNGIICVDEKNKIILVNPKITEILNRQEKDLLDKNINDVSFLKGIKENIIKIIDSIKMHETYTWEDINIKIDDRDAIFNIIGFSFIGEHRKKIITLVFTDITPQEKLKKKLFQSQKMEAIGRLVEGISHEFNNALTGIISCSETIKESLKTKKDIYSELDRIEQFSERAKDLTNNLLVFSERKEHKPELIDLNDFLLNIQHILKRIIKENIDINLYLSDSIKYIYADTSQLEYILINLVINSIDAMPKGGELLLETKNVTFDKNIKEHIEVTQKEYVLLQFSDSGKGMDEETLNHVFEPFYSSKSATGEGLGLFMVYGIMKQNDGFIDIESKKDHGTTFKMYFPARSDTELKKKVPYRKESYRVVKLKGKNVFIVEDDEDLRELLTIYLDKLGAHVFDFGSGKEFLDKIKEMGLQNKKSNIDLLIIDVVLPDYNGKVLLDKIRKKHSNVKVIFMSGYSSDMISNLGLNNKELNFIQKPFSLSDLLKILKRI